MALSKTIRQGFVLRIKSYGPPGSGKSTALDFIHEKMEEADKFKDLEFTWEDLERKILIVKGVLA